MKTIKPVPFYRSPAAAGAKPALGLPEVPRELLDEADYLLNVRMNGPGTLPEYLKLAYAFLEKVNRQFVSTFTPCRKGCSHCCCIDVQITLFEAEYIYLATGIPHDLSTPLTAGHRTSCPFLSGEGACTIYEYRPLFCRTYHVLSSPEICGTPGAIVSQYGSMASDMGNILYRAVMTWIYYQVEQVKGHIAGNVVKDIRDFFPHDPASMRQHMGRVLPGSPC